MKVSLTQFCKLPTISAAWSHTYQDYNYWMTAREKERKGDLIIFECEHGHWVLLPARATVHGEWKAKWNQRVFKFPPSHESCNYNLHFLYDLSLDTTPEELANAIHTVEYEDDFICKELSATDMRGAIGEWDIVFSVTRFVVFLRIKHRGTNYTLEWAFDREFAHKVVSEVSKRLNCDIRLPNPRRV